jgi:hypothetical protein
MTILAPDGAVLGYPKPMTLSSHTMSTVSDRALPFADRVMLGIRSRLHSREGRAVGHALGRLPIPIVTINAWVQLFIPPPKYHVTSLVECDVVDRSALDAVVLMDRGDPLLERPDVEATLDELLRNTEDAYTFPPFATFSPLLVLDGLAIDALRQRERALLRSAIGSARRVRIRVRGHNWSDLLPSILGGAMPTVETVTRVGASAEDESTHLGEAAMATISAGSDPPAARSLGRRKRRGGGR